MGTAYSGVFRGGADAKAVSVGEWPDFETQWNELTGQGLRLTSVSSHLGSGEALHAGIYGSGSDDHTLSMSEWKLFEPEWKELTAAGLRLVSVSAFVKSGVPYFVGAYRAGADAHALVVGDWATFQAKWKALTDQGLRLVGITAYVANGVTYYGGAFRAGTGAHALWVAQTSSFKSKWNELSAQGLRLVSLDSYDPGGSKYYVGVFGPGSDRHHLMLGADSERFSAKRRQLGQQGLFLVDMDLAENECTSGCVDQVVMPSGTYNYGITRTATHCDGLPETCGQPVAGQKVFYRFPVDVDAGVRYARLSAIEHDDQFLTLPFSDQMVKRRGIWRYSNGGWHHAADYSRDDSATFQILACAPGRVVHVGWDTWSGNTVIVSHDVGGVQDSYRTIYMHLRNGALSDCHSAWTQSVPALSEPERSEYIQHLNETGCPQFGNRTPDPAHWGTTQQVIPSILNQQVDRGAFLGWCGNTGPGGKRGTGGPNTHLHVFFCRRDPADNRWYFFDPYGVYAVPGCYATGVTEASVGPCARYPTAWKFGKPQYP